MAAMTPMRCGYSTTWYRRSLASRSILTAALHQPAGRHALAAETKLTPSGYSFNLRYACISRTLNRCFLLSEPGGMIDRPKKRTKGRTKGRVVMEIHSFPELGLAGPVDTAPAQ